MENSLTTGRSERDLNWCREAVGDVSRTFALTVDVLEEPMDDQIAVGYLLCRVADTIEDANHIPASTQASLLRTLDAVLDVADQTTMQIFSEDVEQWMPSPPRSNDDWRVVNAAPTIAATFASFSSSTRRAIRTPVREMVTGMADFAERNAHRPGIRIQTRAELEQYCHVAAGTVGTLITNLLDNGDVPSERSRTMDETAEGFGRLLQLVNIAKDVRADYVEEDNVYLPAEWLNEEGVDQDAVLEPANADGVARVIERVVDMARDYLDDGQEYLGAMPLHSGNTLAAWTVPYLLSVGTLRELERRPKDALTEGGVKISREEVFAVLEETASMSREDIPELRNAIRQEPFHESEGV